MGERNIQIARCNGGRHGLKPVSNGDDNIRAQIVKSGGQLNNTHPGGLGLSNQILTFHQIMNLQVWLEAILANNVNHMPIFI